MTPSWLRGRVKLLVPGKGYGFILPDDGTKDVFFKLSIAGSTPLHEGDVVEYELASGTRVPQAQAIRPAA